ncbi:MAG: hypothetical protein LIP03_10235 [Bacteroidales bacterium]|nr:hypothetical protein [Bacteroidales bacterium]
MRRWFVLLLFVAVLTGTAVSETIHWIVFADTTDAMLGADNVNGKTALYNRFIKKVNAALDQKGYGAKIYEYSGTKMTAEQCNAMVKNLNCGSNDIVVFYYIGHGGRADKYSNDSPWPNMEFQGEGAKYMALIDVHNQLKTKNPRLLVTLGMCCNVAKPSHKKAESFLQQGKKKLKL